MDDVDARIERGASVDELLDRAVAAINRGDRVAATSLAGQVLAADAGNTDLVDSTALSGRVEPETDRMLAGRHRDQVLGIVNRYEGHVSQGSGSRSPEGFHRYPITTDDIDTVLGCQLHHRPVRGTQFPWRHEPPGQAEERHERPT